MKKLLVGLIALGSFSVFACRPNIPAIQHDLAIQALRNANKSVLNIDNVTKTEMKMYFVNTSTAGGCPDKYVINFSLEYNDGEILNAVVTRFRGKYTVEF